MEMTQIQLAELRTQAAEVQAVAIQRSQAIAEAAALRATIGRLTNPLVVEAMGAEAASNNVLNQLAAIEAQCESVVTDMPIYNAKTRDNRKWSPKALYGVSPSVVKIYRLLSGMQYATREHKAQMIALTGISDALCERTMTAFGQRAYFSRNYTTVVPEVAYNIAELKECLQLIEVAMNITLDLKCINEANFNHMFENARLTAERDLIKAEDEMIKSAAIGQVISI